MKGGIRMAYNYSKLLGRIAEKGETRESLCEKIGLSTVALRNKLQGKTQFKQDEIQKIAEVLGIEPEDLSAYFFDA